MSTVRLTSDTVQIRLTRAEKVTGLLRDLDLPRASVRSAVATPDGLRAARGVRAPGLGIPGRRKIGTWRRSGARSLVAVRRGEPALHLILDRTGGWDEVVVGTPEASALARTLGAAGSHPSSPAEAR